MHACRRHAQYGYDGDSESDGVEPNFWRVLSNQEVKNLESLDQVAHDRNVEYERLRAIWWCRHCEFQNSIYPAVVDHVKEQ